MLLPVLTAGMMSLTLIQDQPRPMPALYDERYGGVSASDTREMLQERRDDFMKRWEEVKDARQEKLQTMREHLKERLKKVSDERKQERASSMGERVNAVNDTHADSKLRFLEHLGNILDKIEVRAAKHADNNIDISSVADAIASARSSIASAKEAVLVQKNKVYSVDANSAEPIGQSFGSLVKQMNKDHQALRDGVLKSTKDAVHLALTALKETASSLKADTTGDVQNDE